MRIKEIGLDELDIERFIAEKVEEISSKVNNGIAINALSGGVDSAVVTMLGYRALGTGLKTYFVDNGLMRIAEPEYVVSLFKGLGINIELIEASEAFFAALKGCIDPEEKREAIVSMFYDVIFSSKVIQMDSKYLLQGTNYTDVEETVAKIKRQHNIFEQIGIDPEERYGYKIIEPLIQLRKPAIRMIAKALGLPAEICDRTPFPGPALAARIIGEVTPRKVEIIRHATDIVEKELSNSGAFQYLAILHEDRVTGIKDGKRAFGLQIEVRCWDSSDAVTAIPTRLPYDVLDRLADRITIEVPGVISVTYNITKKPPSTIEAV